MWVWGLLHEFCCGECTFTTFNKKIYLYLCFNLVHILDYLWHKLVTRLTGICCHTLQGCMTFHLESRGEFCSAFSGALDKSTYIFWKSTILVFTVLSIYILVLTHMKECMCFLPCIFPSTWLKAASSVGGKRLGWMPPPPGTSFLYMLTTVAVECVQHYPL